MSLEKTQRERRFNVSTSKGGDSDGKRTHAPGHTDGCAGTAIKEWSSLAIEEDIVYR